MTKTYLSIHRSGEGKLGITICLTNVGVVKQGELDVDFEVCGKSAVERSKVPFSEFNEFEVDEAMCALIKARCSDEWTEYTL